MPFPIVYGLPNDIPQNKLRNLKILITADLVDTMGVDPEMVRPFFPADLLEEEATAYADTIYAQIDTALFHDKNDDKLPVEVCKSLSYVIWLFFDGKREVEVFVGNLNPRWKHLRPPTKES